MRVAVSVSGVTCSETVLSESNSALSALMTNSSATTTNMRNGFVGAGSATTLNRSFSGSGLILLAYQGIGLPGEAKAGRHAGVGIDGIVGCNELQGNTVRDR